MQSVLIAASLFLLLAACTVGCRERSDPENTVSANAKRQMIEPAQPLPASGRMEPGEPAAPFVLTERSGAAFDSASLRGKVWLGSVFFANCPGPCFRENQAIAEILGLISEPDFIAVSLTCDPENDTPDVLRRYADRFEADPTRWKFLTGSMEIIKAVANTTLLLPAEVGIHSERGVVFDREGRLRGSYHLLQPDRVSLLVKLIRDVLAEPAPDAAANPVDRLPDSGIAPTSGEPTR